MGTVTYTAPAPEVVTYGAAPEMVTYNAPEMVTYGAPAYGGPEMVAYGAPAQETVQYGATYNTVPAAPEMVTYSPEVQYAATFNTQPVETVTYGTAQVETIYGGQETYAAPVGQQTMMYTPGQETLYTAPAAEATFYSAGGGYAAPQTLLYQQPVEFSAQPVAYATQETVYAEQPQPANQANLFDQIDTDGDGVLSRAEFAAGMGLITGQ